MDHETSINTVAAEKYVLGELSSPEREQFEEHFFECPECAESVRVGFQFGESARIVFDQDARPVAEPARWSRLRDRFALIRPVMLTPSAVSIAILAFSGYQNTVQIPALRGRVEQLARPQVLSSALLAPSSRRSVPSITISPTAHFFQLSLAIGGIAPAERYECELRAGSGKSITRLPVPELDPDVNLQLLMPTADLSDGEYDAVLSGITGGRPGELEHYRFAISRK
jgi:hypothetical protein